MPADSAAAGKAQFTGVTSTKTTYLLVYNGVSAIYWGAILLQLILLWPQYGYQNIYKSMGLMAQMVQSIAILEIVHSFLGVVRAPLFTTIMQVASRLFLTWAIVYPFPGAAAVQNPFYPAMLTAWSVTEVIRYSFFASVQWELAGYEQDPSSKPAADAQVEKTTTPAETAQKVGLLTWLRYNTFFVLYPVGIGSEVMTIWKAMGEMKYLAGGSLGLSGNGLYGLAWWGCVLILGVYIPGSYVLYTYMMAQRRKVMRDLSKKSSKKTN